MTYDVVIIGGSLAGGAIATLLQRSCPDARVLIVERAERFGRRVGEATVEISGYFLSRVLDLSSHLNDAHLVKQGMRFWFANEDTRTLAEASEMGPRFNVRFPSWQIDRSTIDEELLRRVSAGGAEVRRPARVTAVELSPGGTQRVTVQSESGTEVIECRWAVDASGLASVLPRQEGWIRRNTEHPTAAAWARWRGVKNWDAREFAQRFPEFGKRCFGIRNTATNHIVGDGWWSWWIPLKGGDVSVGVVFDQRLVQFPSDDRPLGDRIKAFLSRHPAAAELLSEAAWIPGDVHWRKNLAYCSTTFAGDGFVVVGDAAAFMDPLYSPGMDWISFTTSAAAALIQAQREGKPIGAMIEGHNAAFARSYRRWFEALYKDKYEYIGDYELMRLAFILDLGLYYFGVVSQPFKYGETALRIPPFSPAVSTPFWRFMRTYNSRFAAIARARRARGDWGRANSRRSYIFQSFSIGPKDLWRTARATLSWLGLEVREAFRRIGNPQRRAAIPVNCR